MGYFDALTSASFKTAADGRKMFYPYGYLGHGYVIPSDSEYDKLRRSYKTIWIVTLVLVFTMVILISIPILPLILAAVFIIWYILWARNKTRDLIPSKEKLTYGEALSNETTKLSMGVLWFFEIISVLFIVYGVILLVANPSQWIFPAAIITLFSVVAVVYARMIRAKRRQAQTPKL